MVPATGEIIRRFAGVQLPEGSIPITDAEAAMLEHVPADQRTYALELARRTVSHEDARRMELDSRSGLSRAARRRRGKASQGRRR